MVEWKGSSPLNVYLKYNIHHAEWTFFGELSSILPSSMGIEVAWCKARSLEYFGEVCGSEYKLWSIFVWCLDSRSLCGI